MKQRAHPIPIPHPTNLALFGHKITLYRFNQGAHTIAGLKSEQGAEPPDPLTLTTISFLVSVPRQMLSANRHVRGLIAIRMPYWHIHVTRE